LPARIREFRISDYSAVLELWKTAGLVIRPGDALEDVKLKLERDPDLFLVAQEEGELVGTVMGAWDGRRGWIYHLAVRPGEQRKGIGLAMVREVEERLMAKGAKKVNAQVYTSNQQSLDFFRAAGYQTQPELVMIGKQLRRAEG
jgi:ribosomal protein S18 acetylase RimI-like enzyme